MWWKKPKVIHPLDRPLLVWPNGEPYTARSLMTHLLILGRTGAAKTTSSGKVIAQAIISCATPLVGGLVLLPKPEDLAMWMAMFRKAGRLNDVIVFDISNSWRFNLLAWLGNRPVRNVVQCLMMIGQTLKRGEGKGGDESQFWEALNERFLYNDVAALKAAGQPITNDRILEFLMTAATSPEQQRSEAFLAGYHHQVMLRAEAREKSPIEAHDFRLCVNFWVKEYPVMDGKTRSNGLAGLMNILHTFNTGLVREMMSGASNCSPDDALKGKWILVNTAPSALGAEGAFMFGAWKYATELAILERQATDDDPVCVVWADEAQESINSFDSQAIAQMRSHKGALIFLTQGASSVYGAMKGETGRHQAEALLGNFGTVVAHAVDPISAKWLSSKLGRRKELLCSGGFQRGPDYSLYDELMGNGGGFSGSFSEHYEQVLQDQEFMIGRTGGPANNYMADSIVIRSGEPFSDGRSYQRVAWSQRG
jgi:hypothetical protein